MGKGKKEPEVASSSTASRGRSRQQFSSCDDSRGPSRQLCMFGRDVVQPRVQRQQVKAAARNSG